MKKLILLLSILSVFALFRTNPALAQIPRTMSYQGLAVDGSGNPISDGPHSLTLKIYDVSSALLYTETQGSVTFFKGMYNVMIGSVTPIPLSVKFDQQYFLGVSIDGGAEMTPRTPLESAPYALHSAIANVALSVDPNATGVVTSINGQDGAITFTGAGGTTITHSGGAFTISSSGGGGTGIQGVQNNDGTLTITNPNGPTASIDITANAIGATKLATDINSLAKVSGGLFSAAAGNVTISGNLNFANDGNSIIFPPTDATNSPMIYMFNTGTQNGDRMVIAHSPAYPSWGIQYRDTTDQMQFLSGGTIVMNVALGSGNVGIGSITNPNAKLEVNNDNNGSQTGAKIANSSASNSGPALDVSTVGTGKVATISNTNAANTNNALEASTAGTGEAIRGTSASGLIAMHGISSVATGQSTGIQGDATSNSNGTGASGGVSGVLGKVTPTAPGGYSAGVRGVNNGTGGTGIGVVGYQAGSGWGVYGETPGGFGVYGLTTNGTGAVVGVRGETFSTGGMGVQAKYSGTGVGTALLIDNGTIKVAGTNKAAFQHTATAANITSNYTTIDNPMTNGDPNAILIVTPVLLPPNNTYANFPIGVWYSTGSSKWTIFNQVSGGGFPTNAAFNVLVIKQ